MTLFDYGNILASISLFLLAGIPDIARVLISDSDSAFLGRFTIKINTAIVFKIKN